MSYNNNNPVWAGIFLVMSGVIVLVSSFYIFNQMEPTHNELVWQRSQLLNRECLPIKDGYGSYMNHTTIWDCGNYGCLTTTNERVFRWAKKESVLLLRVYGSSVWIEDIQ